MNVINRAIRSLNLKEKKKERKRAAYIGWPLVEPVETTTIIT